MIVLALGACNFQQLNPQNAALKTEVRATEMELQVQQTLVAQQATEQNPLITQQAAHATQRAQQAQTAANTPTAAVGPGAPQASGPTALVSQTPPTVAAPEATDSPPALEGSDLLERMQSAQILLYEDMVARNATNRYVKDTLTRMGLPFKDDGNALGWLVGDLQSGPPSSDAWDLVIIALEDKPAAQSGFFGYALQALDQGSAVIVETWFLDTTYNGGGQPFLERCGLAYQGNRIKIAPANMGMFAMKFGHPLLNQPNANIPLSKTNGYWWDATGKNTYDTGDLLKLSNGSEAELVIGAQPNNDLDHGTLAVCEDGKLVVQTFSSHTLTYDTMTLLWENYIYNALKARFEGLE